MSQRAREFFRLWVAANVGPTDIEDAATRVSDMLIAAAAAGISSSEFEEEFPVLDHQLRLATTGPSHQTGA